MKKITSKTGTKLKFRLDGATTLTFSDKPIIVNDVHADILLSRLGSQIIVEDSDAIISDDAASHVSETKEDEEIDEALKEGNGELDSGVEDEEITS